MIIIPTFNNRSSKFEQNIELNGEVYVLVIYWNSMIETWYMDILFDNEAIIRGIALLPNNLLLEEYTLHFEGDFLLFDTEIEEKAGKLKYEDLGGRYELIYYAPGEITNGV